MLHPGVQPALSKGGTVTPGPTLTDLDHRPTAEEQVLRPAIAAFQSGRVAQARRRLKTIVQTYPRSEQGWLWLAETVESASEQRFCLAMVLVANRHHSLARRKLESIGPGPVESPLRTGTDMEMETETVRPAETTADPAPRPSEHPSPAPIALGYLIALTIAELLTVLVVPSIGLLMHGALLVTLLLHTSLTWGRPEHKLWVSLSFAPLIRLLSLTLPLASFPLIYWYLIVSIPLFAATVIIVRHLGLSRADIGLTPGFIPLQILIALTGLSLGYIEYRILQPIPMMYQLTWEELWLPGLILLICTGFAEELIFRGIIQRATTKALGRGWGILYVSVLFAVLHLGYRSSVDVLFVFTVALFFGLTRSITGSILGISIAHGMTNILLFLTLPLGLNHFDLIARYLNLP